MIHSDGPDRYNYAIPNEERPNIIFEFEGQKYEVPFEAYESKEGIVLPDGRLIKPELWLETRIPQPHKLSVQPNLFQGSSVEDIAQVNNAAIAKALEK